jgi:hypothetical protein
MDDWQRKDFEALDSGWKRAVLGSKHKATYQRGWLERPRGHSKSLDLGIMAAFALFASRRRLSGIGAAGDRDQARILRDAIGRLVFINPWLGRIIEVQNYRVVNSRTESALDIISSDAPTSYGLTPDFLICDEVTHWPKRDLWDSLVSSAAKRASCMFVVITNAGLDADWQWKARESIRSDPKWYFSRLEGPQASWITADRLEEQERLLPSIAFKRLWLNEWTSGGGDALTPETIDRAFRKDLRPMSGRIAGYEFTAGLDLGVSRDASALCILGVNDGHIRLAHTRVWRPTKGQKVNLVEVESALLKTHALFHLKSIAYDSWQATYLAQRLQSDDFGRMVGTYKPFTPPGGARKTPLPMIEVPSTQKYLQAMASTCLEVFNDGRLELYPDAELEKDLRSMRVEERGAVNGSGTGTGFRMVFPRTSLGHGDLGQAFLYALLAASELAGKKKIVAGPIQVDPVVMADRRFERLRAETEKLMAIGSASPNPFQKLARLTGRNRFQDDESHYILPPE